MAKAKKTVPTAEVKVKIEMGETRMVNGELRQEIKITPPLELDSSKTRLLKIEDAHFAFPTKSRCPKCKTLATRAQSTQGEIQKRICLRPSCRTNYKESGMPV